MKDTHLFQIGNNPQKRVLILSSIHGNELSGLIILRHMHAWLAQTAQAHNLQFDILPFFNHTGIAARSRIEPQSRLDLNRCFNQAQPPQIIKKLKKLASNCQLVLDLHCFPNTRHAFTALLFQNSAHTRVSSVNRCLVQLLGADFIWKLDASHLDRE